MTPQAAGGDYMVELLRVVVVLVLIGACAFWILRWLAQRGGLNAPISGLGARMELRVLARVGLEPRKALYLVRAGERLLLLGTGDSGPPSLLLELPRDQIADDLAQVASDRSPVEPVDG
jgi:flagellar biogenesis protein FliO